MEIVSHNIYNCMWCSLEIKNHPIGCPTKVIFKNNEECKNRANEEDFETLTEDDFNLMRSANDKLSYTNEHFLNFDHVFEVYGLFCSFNCVKSYILYISFVSSKFKNSMVLLNSMLLIYYDKVVDIKHAEFKDIMIQYGGNINIDKYINTYRTHVLKDNSIINMKRIRLS